MGFFSKLFGLSSDKKSSNGKEEQMPVPTVVVEDDEHHTQDTIRVPIMKQKQRYVVKTEGQYRVYSRKEDMPEEIRKEVDEMEYIADNASTCYTVYVDGKRMNYKSLDDVPSEIRNAVLKSDLH